MQSIYQSLKPLFFVLVLGVLFSCKKDDSSKPTNPVSTTVTDIDGNTYNTVTIGNQVWMKENLKVSKYRNGDPITTNLTDSLWETTTSGAYSIYNNDPANNITYGKLYNFYAVSDPRGLCPTGWHVPTDHDWNLLTKYLDPGADTVVQEPNSINAGGAMKAVSSLWWQPNEGASNSSGFTALPGGYRINDGFSGIGQAGHWWSSTGYSNSSAWGRFLGYDNANSNRGNSYGKTFGFSVRCLRD